MFEAAKALKLAVGGYLAGVVADFVSSLGMPAGFVERNPFARDMFGRFSPQHAALNGVMNTIPLVGFSLLLYCVGESLDKRSRFLLASIPWLYPAYEHLDAAFHNLQIHLHLFQPVWGF